MLKTVSSVANALGALNYKGTWNASTNTPTLASGVGNQGDYYVVSVDGTTNLDGITNWGVGDWAAFNGSVWQRVEGGADGNFVDLSVTGEATVGTISPSYSVLLSARNAGGSFEWGHSNSSGYPSTMGAESGSGSPYVAFNAGPGTNSNTYKTLGILGTVIKTDTSGNLRIGRLTTASADNQTPVESAVFTNSGNLQFPSGQGIDFAPTAGTGTSELFDDYEEGAFLPVIGDNSANLATMAIQNGRYTKIGNLVNWYAYLSWTSLGSISGLIRMNGLPFTSSSASNNYASVNCNFASGLTVTAGNNIGGYVELNQAYAQLTVWSATTGTPDMPAASLGAAGSMMLTGSYEV